ncbi:MAG: FecR domain-containing protein [Lachnospiraceae bacterium]|nr:FecR domain-containing protein [Lachnospiraceae bacterium]
MNKGKKGLLIGIIAGGLVLVGGLVALIILLGKKQDTFRVIKVMKAEGHCYVTRGDVADLEAYEGMALQSGDYIHVDGNSSMVLMLDEDKLAYVEQNTDFNLIAEGSSKDSRTKIELTKGALTCEIQKDLGSGSTYEVNTPNSTMAVRGTSFRVEVTDVDTIKKVLESSAVQPSMLFMAKTLESSGIQGMNTITRLTVTDGTVSVQLHDENGNKIGDEIDFKVDTDVLIGGNDSNSCIIKQITGIDPSTFPAVTIEFFIDIATGSGKMVISLDDLKDQDNKNKGPHMVTFMYGSVVFATQTVDYEAKAVEPQLMPEESGHWDVDFSLPVTTDTLVYWVSDN